MTVSIDIDKMTNLAKVPVYVNGRGPFTFVLDTGAKSTTLTSELARELNLSTYSHSQSEMARLSASVDFEYASIDSFQVDSVSFDQQEVLVMDLNRRMDCGTRHGVLGYSMLRECVLGLSYPAQTVNLSRDMPSELSGRIWSDFGYAEGTHLALIPTSINGNDPVDFVLDTGAGSTVITPEFANSLKLDYKEVNGIARGIEGDTRLILASINELSVGGTSATGLTAAVIDMSKVSSRGSSIKNGILGYNFLRHCELWLDYPNQRYMLYEAATH